MGQMFDKTSDQMNNWRWGNHHTFGDQFNSFNPQPTSSGKVKRTGDRFSWYGSNDSRAKIEPPSCQQYTPGDFLAIRPVNWDEIINVEDDDENRADPRAPSSGRSCPGDGNDNDNGEGEEDKKGCETETGKGKGTKNGKGKQKAAEDRMGKGKGKGKGKGNIKVKGIVKQTPGGDDIFRTVALQWQKKMSEGDLDTEG